MRATETGIHLHSVALTPAEFESLRRKGAIKHVLAPLTEGQKKGLAAKTKQPKAAK